MNSSVLTPAPSRAILPLPRAKSVSAGDVFRTSIFDDSAPLRVCLQAESAEPLREFCRRHADQLVPAGSPDEAEVILHGHDDPAFVMQTPEFRRWPEKCVMVTEFDLPTYFLPACYASNRRGWFARRRSETVPFFLSQMTHPNPAIFEPQWRAERRYLYAFLGGSTSWVRKRLFRLRDLPGDALIEATDHYQHWNDSETYLADKRRQQERYAEVLHDAWYFLCPRGAGVSSIRLFEVMQAGVAPVILSDDWIPPPDIPWKEFALFLPESHTRRLDAFVRAHASEAAERGRRARAAWEQHCAPTHVAVTLTRALRRLQRSRNPRREERLRAIFPLVQGCRSVARGGRQTARRVVLRLMGKYFPYQLNRPLPPAGSN